MENNSPQNGSGQFAYRRQKLEEAKKRKKALQETKSPSI